MSTNPVYLCGWETFSAWGMESSIPSNLSYLPVQAVGTTSSTYDHDAPLDALLQILPHQVGLAQPSPQEKLVIQVLPNSVHHRRTLNPFKLPAALPVSSPTLLPIPVPLTEADMLRDDILRHLAA